MAFYHLAGYTAMNIHMENTLEDQILDKIRTRLLVYGVVQGVGFRPFVDRLARAHHLSGWVLNSSSGIEIEVEGRKEDVERFIRDFPAHAPSMSLITHMDVSFLPATGYTSFAIRKSLVQFEEFTLISPDIGTCQECLQELFDVHDRRYGYPFINCTNCGPRYTIIYDIPYDRPNTTMKKFHMCPACEQEYHNPNNRRFHAQPNACRECGPRIWLADPDQKELAVHNPLSEAKNLLANGKILAMKGLGGFHLVCDAHNEEAVRNLRQRKRREEKPFAVMVRNISDARSFCFISAEEEESLSSPKRPIVLLKKRNETSIAPSVAPGSHYFGIMLPYTPLHYLLMSGPYTALVMTSGNISQEPIVISNEEAFKKLKGIADFYLLHDRDIYTRSDDSVIYLSEGKERLVRRSRGYCPLPIHLGYPCREILACGAELKNTITLTRAEDAFVSQYIGDLENMETLRFFEHTINKMKRIIKVHPKIIAYDMHPDYLSTQYARQSSGYEVKIPVQHHHAHVASCMAEHGIREKVIGLAWDGTGYGTDGCVWGGEFLVADYASFLREAHFSYVPLPGGSMAIREPYRMAISYLFQTFGRRMMDLKLPFMEGIDRQKLSAVLEIIEKGIHSPLTSSAGRIFEAISSLLGLRHKNTFEGQAAIELEYLAASVPLPDGRKILPYPYSIIEENQAYKIDITPMIRKIVEEIEKHGSSHLKGGTSVCSTVPTNKGTYISRLAYTFHLTMAEIAVQVCLKLQERHGLKVVVFSGGVFQNRLLTSLITERLRKERFTCLIHQKVPANDGGISLGQAVIANCLAEGRL